MKPSPPPLVESELSLLSRMTSSDNDEEYGGVCRNGYDPKMVSMVSVGNGFYNQNFRNTELSKWSPSPEKPKFNCATTGGVGPAKTGKISNKIKQIVGNSLFNPSQKVKRIKSRSPTKPERKSQSTPTPSVEPRRAPTTRRWSLNMANTLDGVPVNKGGNFRERVVVDETSIDNDDNPTSSVARKPQQQVAAAAAADSDAKVTKNFMELGHHSWTSGMHVLSMESTDHDEDQDVALRGSGVGQDAACDDNEAGKNSISCNSSTSRFSDVVNDEPDVVTKEEPPQQQRSAPPPPPFLPSSPVVPSSPMSLPPTPKRKNMIKKFATAVLSPIKKKKQVILVRNDAVNVGTMHPSPKPPIPVKGCLKNAIVNQDGPTTNGPVRRRWSLNNVVGTTPTTMNDAHIVNVDETISVTNTNNSCSKASQNRSDEAVIQSIASSTVSTATASNQQLQNHHQHHHHPSTQQKHRPPLLPPTHAPPAIPSPPTSIVLSPKRRNRRRNSTSGSSYAGSYGPKEGIYGITGHHSCLKQSGNHWSLDVLEKTVAFSNQVRMKFTLHRNDYTDEEFDSVWYYEDELNDMLQEATATLNVMKMSGTSMMMMNSNAMSLHNSFNNSGGFNTNTASYMNAMNVASRSTFHLSQMLCCRGLEYMSEQGKQRQAAIRQAAYDAVVQEQDRQRALGISLSDGEELVAFVYKKCSQRPSIAANMLGSLDATEAMNIYDDSDVDELMMQAANFNSSFNNSTGSAGFALFNASLPNFGSSLVPLPFLTSPRKAKRRNSAGSVTNDNFNASSNTATSIYTNFINNGGNVDDPMEMGRIVNGLLTHVNM